MLNAIVFDFDGVIVDSEPLHFQAILMVGLGIGFRFDYERYLSEFVGYDDRDAFGAILDALPAAPDDGDRDSRIADLCAQKRQTFENLISSDGAAALPGALELAQQARDADLPIAIASGATRFDIELMLESLGKRDLFELIVSADDVAKSKPDPQTYALAAERLGIAPDGCLAIEDTRAGIISARGAGLATLAVTTTAPAEALRDADRVVENLSGATLDQLRQWYE